MARSLPAGLAGSVDLPRPGTVVEGREVEICGWAMNAGAPALAVAVTLSGPGYSQTRLAEAYPRPDVASFFGCSGEDRGPLGWRAMFDLTGLADDSTLVAQASAWPTAGSPPTVLSTCEFRARLCQGAGLGTTARELRDELARLSARPQGAETSTELVDPPMRIADGPSFVSQYKEIFISEAYDFPFEGTSPTIIDGGANIGTAVIWWRTRWPDARILAFEPDPKLFELLRWNTRCYSGLEIHQCALYTQDDDILFSSEGTDAGHIYTDDNSVNGDLIWVKAIRLSLVLRTVGKVHLLKLDIEGAELEVLREAEPLLKNVERIFVEYHSFEGRNQNFGDLLTLLQNNSYRYYVTSEASSMRPFKGVSVNRGLDLQCNVFAWRV